ncbi:hypothetical protein ACQEVY_23555 [Streptomyces sp. CA-288835]|uniref:hypothetical protein n=1 Tax=Streptomyces sp. CA-288835 TaxID=3240069 RepID=UPI003D8DD728
MAQDSWPSPAHNARAVTDTEYERLAARFSDDGVYGSPLDIQVVTAGAGLSVDIRAGVYASVRGHTWASGATTVNLPITANGSGQTRTDIVVLRLDRADWTVRAVVKEGAPGAGAPGIVQYPGDTGVWEIYLAVVTLLSGAGTVTVRRNELYVGSRVRPLTSITHNPFALPGELQYETDTGRLNVYDGTARRTVFSRSDIVSAASPLAQWSIIVEPVLELRNGSIHFRLGQFERTAGLLDNATASRLPVLIPAEYRHPSRNTYAIAYLSGARIGRLTIYPNNHATPGQVWLTQKPDINTGDHVQPGDVSWAVD